MSPAVSAAQTTSFASKVHHDGDRVIIDGVVGPSFQRYASSMHGACATIMEAVGAPISYDELVGFGGLAFRVQIHRTGTCPSSPHCHVGYMCLDGSMAANPWESRAHILEWLDLSKPADVAKLREARRLVMESIDRGIPVQYGDIEDGVIIGYQAGGEEWICLHPMHDRAEKLHIEKTPTWYVAIYSGPKATPPDRLALARKSLEQAITMWSTPRQPPATDYYVGEAAWRFWIENLGKVKDEDSEQARTGQQGNAWTYDATTSYRRSAVIYLRKIAPLFDASAAEHLQRAADIYARMADEVLSDPRHSVTDIAPYPVDKRWNVPFPSDRPWTAQQRGEQIRRMKQAMELDREAIGELKLALDQ